MQYTEMHPDGRPQTALLIMGVHRSGTSALTRSLALCGPSLPSRMLEPGAANPAGFWEPSEIISLHDQFLAEAGSSWDDILDVDPQWFEGEVAAGFRRRLSELITSEYGSASQFLVKDPRICKLFPLWRDTLDEMGVVVKIVIPIRHPVEVAKSLHKRNGFPFYKGVALWLRNFLATERDSRGFPRVFIKYDDLLSNPVGVLEHIGATLGLSWGTSPSGIRAELGAFLKPDLRHHEAGTDGESELTKISGDVASAWEWAQQAAATGRVLETGMLDEMTSRIKSVEPQFEAEIRWLRMQLRTVQTMNPVRVERDNLLSAGVRRLRLLGRLLTSRS